DAAPGPLDRDDLERCEDSDLPLSGELAHLLGRGAMRAELVAAMNDRDLARDPLQAECPVHRRIAAANDRYPASLEIPRLADVRVNPTSLAVVLGPALALEDARVERPLPCRDDDGSGQQLPTGCAQHD